MPVGKSVLISLLSAIMCLADTVPRHCVSEGGKVCVWYGGPDLSQSKKCTVSLSGLLLLTKLFILFSLSGYPIAMPIVIFR